MNSANSFLPWIYIVFHGTYVRDATTIWLAGTRLHGNSPEIAVQFQSSPRNSLEIHLFSSVRGATRLRIRTWKRSNSFLGRISYADELSSPQWQIRVHTTPSGSANDCVSLCAKLTNFPFPLWLLNFNVESTCVLRMNFQLEIRFKSIMTIDESKKGLMKKSIVSKKLRMELNSNKGNVRVC